jgi:hypothetical protein
MEPDLAVPAFIRTLTAMKRTLAQHDNWRLLHRHLDTGQRSRIR